MRGYRCHKIVQAGKIREIGRETLLIEGEESLRWVGIGWMQKHEPVIGGYLVIYEDGYASFSPAEAFEKGYTLIEE